MCAKETKGQEDKEEKRGEREGRVPIHSPLLSMNVKTRGWWCRTALEEERENLSPLPPFCSLPMSGN